MHGLPEQARGVQGGRDIPAFFEQEKESAGRGRVSN